jgi:SPP1 family phage portal protein
MNADLTSKELSNIIDLNRSYLADRRALYDRYTGDVDILDRVLTGRTAVQLNLANDFRGIIVDQCNAYLHSIKITYRMKDTEDTENNKILQDFISRNDTHSKDMLQDKLSSICGYSGRLLYLNTKGEESFEVLNPWECLWVFDHFGKIEIALRWYSYIDTKNETTEYCEIYDSEKTVFYALSSSGWSQSNTIPHYFGIVPLIRFENNPDLLGDFEKVEGLIDAVDEIISSSAEELLEHRLAILAFSGAQVNEAELEKSKGDGFGALNLGQDSSASWLIKELPFEYLDKVLKYLERNIFRFSASIDMADETFSGSAQTGESRKWKILQLEGKAGIKENMFKSALKSQFNALAASLAKRGISFPSQEMEISFNRNLPVSLTDAGQVFNDFWGKISPETVLALMPFINDPAAEAAKIESKNNELDLLIQENTNNNNIA